MDAIHHGIIVLIKSAITGEALPLPEGFYMEKAVPVLTQHGLLALGYAGAVNCGIDPDTPLMTKLQDLYLMEYYTSDCQLKRLQQIFDAFEENGIDYMPLKGTVLKGLYHSHEMRTMSDADILIHPEQREKIAPIMERIGFTLQTESNHEWIWKCRELKVELHKRLVSSNDKDYYRYFGEGWQFAKYQEGHRWSMTEDDAFVFEFVHFARHYCSFGVSVRNIVDLWIHMRRSAHLDTDYICAQLEKMQMATFYGYIRKLMDAWFYDGQWDERTEFISDYIFSGGVTKAVSDRARSTQKTGDVRSGVRHLFLRRIFPKKEVLLWYYPQLKNVPLPLAWAARWVSLLTTRKNVVQKRFDEMGTVSPEDVTTHLKNMNYVGLHYSETVDP